MKKDDKHYEKSITTRKRSILLSVTVIFYILMFTSNIWMPARLTSTENLTVANKNISFANDREYIIYSVEHSEEQGILEIIMEFENYSHNGLDDYYYLHILTGARQSKDAPVTFTEVINDQLVTVLRFENLHRFKELNLYIAPATVDIAEVTDDMIATIILNSQHNVTKVENIDLNKSKTDYLLYRMDYVISECEKEITGLNEERIELLNSIEGLQRENEDLKDSEKYMTESEIAAAQEIYNDNEAAINELKAKVITKDDEIEDAEARLKENKEIRAQLLK